LEAASEALDDRHRLASPVAHARVPRPMSIEAEHGADGDAEDRAAKRMVPGAFSRPADPRRGLGVDPFLRPPGTVGRLAHAGNSHIVSTVVHPLTRFFFHLAG